MKFGGASVASPEQFSAIADIIGARLGAYERILVVVSAMGTMTDELLELAKRVHPSPPRREQDMLVSVGERISSALLAMALSLKGLSAVSFTGSQSGIITSARHTEANILEVRPWRLVPHLEQGKVVIAAGFQGVSRGGEITTLGRGGSDTSAVALAVALSAERVEFYKDVAGLFSADPKTNSAAQFLPRVSYREARAIVARGAKVLHERSIALAERNGLPLYIYSFKEPQGQHTLIADDAAERPAAPIYENEQ